MENTNITFEKGKTYFYTYITDSNLKVYLKVIKRTAQTVWLENIKTKETMKKRTSFNHNIEQCKPQGNNSMAPILSADKEGSEQINYFFPIKDDYSTAFHKAELAKLLYDHLHFDLPFDAKNAVNNLLYAAQQKLKEKSVHIIAIERLEIYFYSQAAIKTKTQAPSRFINQFAYETTIH